ELLPGAEVARREGAHVDHDQVGVLHQRAHHRSPRVGRAQELLDPEAPQPVTDLAGVPAATLQLGRPGDEPVAQSAGREVEEFPEDLIVPRLHNTWHDSAEAVINNWIGKVYQITSVERARPFRDGIDPDNPLCLTDIRRNGAG
ncbi:MAG: hypothetical protein R3318_03795, partial [Gammaproteobacteria bacterium]|nr:hypothetical protein [Gammaproteobacteria bacterium]